MEKAGGIRVSSLVRSVTGGETVCMGNPLDFETDDARFVKATKDYHEREMRITRLTISRNWFIVGLLFQSLFLLAILILDYRKFLSESSMQFSMYVLNAAALYHTDLQIKLLKASRKESN